MTVAEADNVLATIDAQIKHGESLVARSHERIQRTGALLEASKSAVDMAAQALLPVHQARGELFFNRTGRFGV